MTKDCGSEVLTSTSRLCELTQQIVINGVCIRLVNDAIPNWSVLLHITKLKR